MNTDLNRNVCSLCEESKEDLIDVTKELERMGYNFGKNILACRECITKHGLSTKQNIEQSIIEDIKARMKTPKEIVEYLDEIVMGQDRAKKTLAVEVRNHFKRITSKDKINGRTLRKNNILLTGPSGTGKTLLVESLAKILNVPFASVSATSLTESGYVGSDVESVLSTLLRNADKNPERAKYGIVFIDEIDKIARKGENMSITRDVSGEGVQTALLKMIEGTVVAVPENGGRIHPNQPLVEIDTTDILFVCAGAFEGIESIVEQRLKNTDKSDRGMGFGAKIESKSDKKKAKELRSKIKVEDLQKFGMIPELLGRLPFICNLMPLEQDDLVNILNSKHGILEECKLRLELEDKTLEFSEDCVSSIAKLALERNVGARGLRGILNNLMLDILFEAPSSEQKHYVIDYTNIEDYCEEDIEVA